ncbi:MAG: hypothetical protein DYG98_02180 [Haliscomenobacteraceae bacterium CHB4]|nr:hypothetical protein [Saprospiraceae bacterium]MCE7921840.1 hypothetical protein [Haliscomenobacteraceae bacterium CHB4]
MTINTLKSEIAFWLHLMITVAAWVAPFLFSWQWSVPVYAAVMVQFAVFGRCLVNEHHDLSEDDNVTFYSHLFERMGFRPDRRRLKFYVRKVCYPVLAAFSILWQEVLNIEPLLF